MNTCPVICETCSWFEWTELNLNMNKFPICNRPTGVCKGKELALMQHQANRPEKERKTVCGVCNREIDFNQPCWWCGATA